MRRSRPRLRSAEEGFELTASLSLVIAACFAVSLLSGDEHSKE